MYLQYTTLVHASNFIEYIYVHSTYYCDSGWLFFQQRWAQYGEIRQGIKQKSMLYEEKSKKIMLYKNKSKKACRKRNKTKKHAKPLKKLKNML